MLLDVLDRDRQILAHQLFVDALGLLQPALDRLKGIALVLLGEHRIEHLEPRLHLHDHRPVLHHQFTERLRGAQLLSLYPDDLLLPSERLGLPLDLFLELVLAVKKFDRIPHSVSDDRVHKRFVDKVRNAQLKTLVFHLDRVLTADDQHRDIVHPPAFPHAVDHGKAVHFRHMQIQQERCRLIRALPQLLQRLRSVCSHRHHRIGLEYLPQQFAVHLRVVDY